MRALCIISFFLFVHSVASQQIWDIWQTTWDRSKLLTRLPQSSPINFVTPGPIGSANIEVLDTQLYQNIDGFGSTLTDSSALTLINLKNTNPTNYNNLLRQMFDATDGAATAGLNYIRLPIGASDFSPYSYSWDDSPGDTSFSCFSVTAPCYVFSVLQDIRAINNRIKVHILPWSPPGWMKTTGVMTGGSLASQYVSIYSTYLLKAVQGVQNQGISVYAISTQNEPQNNNPTYPTCTMTPQIEGQIGTSLRTLLDNNGLSNVKIVGYEHNWDTAGAYPITLMQDAGNAFSGVAFHCYGGDVTQQDTFHNAYPSKEIYFTECSGTFGTDWWSDMKWYMDKLFVGSLEHNARNALMWNFALDGSGNPKLPGTNSCGGPGCRPLITVNSDGSFSPNQEFWAMAQASRAIVPKDPGGPFGQRIGVSVTGTLNWALRVGAYVAGRTSTQPPRYSLVVLNWYDNASTTWNPVPVTTTILFRGMQATITFPVGITTIWWFAPAPGIMLSESALRINSTTIVPGDWSSAKTAQIVMQVNGTTHIDL